MTANQSNANRVMLFLMIAAALGYSIYAVRHTVSCFLLSFIFAYLLDPFIVFLERRKQTRTQGIICLYVLSAVLTLFFFYFIAPIMILSWQKFIPSIPIYLQKLNALGEEFQTRYEPLYGAEEWRWIFNRVMLSLDKILNNIGNGVYAAAGRLVFNLFNLVLSPILVYFMLYYKETIKTTIVSWLPTQHRNLILEVGHEINDSIGGYIKGQFIVSFIVALLSSTTLLLMNVDYPIFNGIFAGLASILPFIGVIIATIPALFFAYVKFQTVAALVKVLAAFAVIYFIEGYLIKPLVFKRSMNLNPLVTIIVVMAFGEMLGFWGIILAIPIAAALKILSIHLRRGDFAENDRP